MQTVLFIAFPYIAVILAIGAALYRYFTNRYSFSSLSSQLLENRQLFWGSTAWHFGIILILLAHALAWLFPGAAGFILGAPYRLAAIETAGLALAFWTVFGLIVLIIRRLPVGSRPRAVTSAMDWLLLILLLIQTLTGAVVALFDRWGSLWYLSTAVPWLWSLLKLRPDIGTVAALPGLIQFHFVLGFAIILLFPFSRLVHIFAIPFEYMWRPYQVVIWNRERKRGGSPAPSMSEPALASGPVGNPPAGDPPTSRSDGDPDPERRWMTRTGILAGAVAGGVIAAPSIGFLLGLRKAPAVWRTLGRVQDFQVGQTVEVSFLDPTPLPWAGVTAKTAAWLRRADDQEFIAFAINCTHLGCPVRWLPTANLFMCPCHGGVFYSDGRVASGPPPKPLVRYPVRVLGGEVQILASQLPIGTS